MNFRDLSWLKSTEVCTGIGLIAGGIAAHVVGVHGIFALALAPFGIGLILSEFVSHAARSARERVKIRIRRDDE